MTYDHNDPERNRGMEALRGPDPRDAEIEEANRALKLSGRLNKRLMGEMDTLLAQNRRLREALQDLLKQFEPSKITEPVMMDNEQFSEFLKGISQSTDEAVAKARAALSQEQER